MALRKPVIGIPEGGPHTALGELPTGDQIDGADVDISSAAHNDLGGKEGTGPEFIHLNAAELAAIAAHLVDTANPHAVTAAQVGALTQAAADLLYAALAHAHAAGDITSGTFADARIAASNVTQHNGALTHAGLNGGGSPPIAAHPPVGGSAGQVLTKIDGTNYNWSWATPSSGGFTQRCKLRRTTNFSVPNATPTIPTFTGANSVEVFDPTNMHDPSTNPSRITIATAGLYLAGFDAAWEADSGGDYRMVEILKNGTTIQTREKDKEIGGPDDTVHSSVTLMSLAAADYLELRAEHDQGGAWNILALADYSLTFWVHRIA
jgi:hypothetical protein